ncbi:GNAT family N-acetyltransferase [Alphaproteobacteria bacterium KMM 3653]|uniref:GNAT family N-acetyltransferase n=1 Tax=Harenicola maris TaxID=2841044 RepID=A0AAP2G5E4_9RHOB|nr:GNAT family N-acetyltransferase [Harenicola maris]
MTLIPTLQTERLTLRAPQQGDYPALAEFYASERSHFVGGPQTHAQTWRTLAAEIGHWHLRGYGRWAVEETATGAFCGMVGPWCPEGWPEPEIAYDLMGGFEGKGYATEAATAALDFVFNTLNWKTAISFVAPENHASAALARRLGAQQEGTFDLGKLGTVNIFRHPKEARI